MLYLVLGWFLLVYHQENVYNGIYPLSFNTFADFNKQTQEKKKYVESTDKHGLSNSQ